MTKTSLYVNIRHTWGDNVFEKLKIKAIYDDFLENVSLSEEQIRILDMLIQKETIVKIALEIGASQRTINYEIRKIKDLYKDYCELQITRALLLLQ